MILHLLAQVNTVQLVLEPEGSSSSPANISKVPGTSYHTSTPSSSSSGHYSSSSSSSSSSGHYSSSSSSFSSSPSGHSSSSSSKSMTEMTGPGRGDELGLGFGFEGHASSGTTHSTGVSCSKTIHTHTVHTKDGPVERREEVIEGGPECKTMPELTSGGLKTIFPSVSHVSTSHSTGGTKGSLFTHSKFGFGDPFASDLGFDHGAFAKSYVDDDVPDFHARSVKTTHVERTADFTGTGTKGSPVE